MAITTRAGKGSALTHAELDANFTELGLSHGDTTIALSVDSVTVEGNVTEKTTTIGDYETTSNNYAVHGFQVEAGDQAWAGVILKEHSGSTGKPVQSLANPSFSSIISGGTVASPAALESGKRLLSLFGMGTLDASGSTPTFAPTNIVMETTEEQTLTSCGGKIKLETSPNGRTETTIRTTTLELQDNVVTINTDGNGILKSGGDLTLQDDVNVTGTLEVDGTLTANGSVTLGDANTDSVNVNGIMYIADTAGLKIANMTKATADYLDANSLVPAGGIAFITDGSRPNVPIFYDGTDWRYFSDSTVIAS